MGVYQDPSGRSAGRGALILRGAIVLVVGAVIAVLLRSYGNGDFTPQFTLNVEAATVGDGLLPGADVKYRGFAIGHVESVTATGDGSQSMVLTLDPKLVDTLTDTLTARYAPSSAFGTTGIELVGQPGGQKLKDNATVRIGKNASVVLITQVLRQIGQVASTLSSDELTRSVDRISTTVTQIAPLLRASFDVTRVVIDNRVVSLTDLSRWAADALNGATALEGPFVDVFATLNDRIAVYDDPEVVKHTISGLAGALSYLGGLVGVVGDNDATLQPLLGIVTALGVPGTATLASAVPSLNNLGSLLDRISSAFPLVNGQVRLQLELALKGGGAGLLAPLTASFATGGALPAPPTGGN